MITEDDNDILGEPPTVKEVKDAVFNMSPDSAPGPDRVSGKIYQHCWDIISVDLFNMVCDFFAGT